MDVMTVDHPARIGIVIEDDAPTRHILVRALQRLHINTRGFGSGEAALAWVELNGTPDIVTVDVTLPAMCGLRVCEWFRTMPRTRHVPLILVTAHTGAQDMAAAHEVGAAYLAKPFRLQELTDMVMRLLKSA